MVIEIRPMQPGEVPAARNLVLEVASRLFQPEDTAGFIARHQHTLADVNEYQRDYSPPDGLFLVALDGGRLIGTGAIRRWDDSTAELRRMWLLEPYQGRGIGYRLWLALREFSTLAGYVRIRLTTDEENQRARAFYQRLGFVRVEQQGPTAQEIYLEMTLNDDDPN